MEYKIYRMLIHIISYRKDLVSVITPFLNGLNQKSATDEQFQRFLKTLSRYSFEVLKTYGNIENEKIVTINKSRSLMFTVPSDENIEEIIDEIIEGDNLEDLQIFLQYNNFEVISSTIKPFNEVERLKIPLLQYCLMKKAFRCFKFLLMTGLDNPRRTCEEQNPNSENHFFCWKSYHRYEFDCIATAIFLGETGIAKTLEEKGFPRSANSLSVESAILSYRYPTVEEIISEIEEYNKDIYKATLNRSLFASAKCNFVRVGEYLIRKGANVNATDIFPENILLLFLMKMFFD